jgi:hypothetical protein
LTTSLTEQSKLRVVERTWFRGSGVSVGEYGESYLHGPAEPEYETRLVGRPRPNVLLEAGMAFGAQPTRTILVELGDLRPVSDLTGRNVIRLGAAPGPLHALVQ